MENKSAVVVGETNEIWATESESIETIIFDKNEMYRDLTDGLKHFGTRCCEDGKECLAPLASKMTKHFFNWLISLIWK